MAQYVSYMLRVWRSSRHGRGQWVARLEDLHDGRSEQFSSKDALIAHLSTLLEHETRNGPDPPAGDKAPMNLAAQTE
jgi:hypothetical protein